MIVIGIPTVTEKGDKTCLSATIEKDGQVRTLWFAVDRRGENIFAQSGWMLLSLGFCTTRCGLAMI